MGMTVEQNEQGYGTQAAARVMNRFRFADSMHRSSLSFLIRTSYWSNLLLYILSEKLGRGK